LTSILVLEAVLALACAGVATAYKPTIVQLGEPAVELNGGFKPTKLPKNKLAPIHLNLSGKVNTPDGTHPPALQEVILETDKNVTIDAKGLASCKPWRIEAAVSAPWVEACTAAQVGKGEMEFEVEFPEEPPFSVKSHAVAFNTGVKGGVTTILIHAFLPNPLSLAFVTQVEISKVHHGRYGNRWLAAIPVIAGGSGSVKKFEFEFFRMFHYKGKRQSYLLAKCPDGKLQTAWKATLSDGSDFAGRFVRPCTPKG
jgi:hypothetical protein